MTTSLHAQKIRTTGNELLTTKDRETSDIQQAADYSIICNYSIYFSFTFFFFFVCVIAGGGGWTDIFCTFSYTTNAVYLTYKYCGLSLGSVAT